MSRSLAALCLFLAAQSAFAISPTEKGLPRGLTPAEAAAFPKWAADRLARLQGSNSVRPGDAPLYGVKLLGEWEEADGIMANWPNADMMRKYADRATLHVLADTDDDTHWWEAWLSKNKVKTQNVVYDVVPTDSIWVRDYGPWWILDGVGKLGVLDPIYNRPRPLDDVVPAYFAKKLGLPHYDLPLIHTGGNFYADGFGKAFSSTLVYTENPGKERGEVDSILKNWGGVSKYVTENLGKDTTIEHMDTFGKLVAPDTWVFAEFPEGNPYRADVDRMIRQLQAMNSPYGTPYRIFQIPMMLNARGEFRAYINSFIHNHTLFYAAYDGGAAGETGDEIARKVYQAALPDYELVPIEAMDTEWGDSVHCRSRNVISQTATFLFPTAYPQTDDKGRSTIYVKVAPPKGRFVTEAKLFWSLDGRAHESIDMIPDSPRDYHASLPTLAAGSKVRLYVEAHVSDGSLKRGPGGVSERQIEFEIPAGTK